MAHQLAFRPAARRLATLPSVLAQPSRTASAPRFATTSAADPKAKANSFIDSLPGNNAITKTGWVTLGASLTGYAISNELYVMNEETVIMASFLVMIGYLGTVVRGPYKEWADSTIEKYKGILNASRAEHTNAVKDRIANVSEIKDVVSVTKSLFDVSRDTAVTEHEIFKLKQKMAVKDEIKSILDGWVRVETQAREAEQAELVKTILANVNKQLADPKFQKEVLATSVTEIEALIRDKKI